MGSRISGTLPAWLTAKEHNLSKPANKWWFSYDYLEKSLSDIQNSLTYTMQQVSIAGQEKLLQQLEPRCKAFGAGILILAAAVSHNLYGLCLLNFLVIAASLAAGIRISSYMSRVVVPVAVFSGIAVIPAIFNVITPGSSLYVIYSGSLGHGFPGEISITQQGLSVCFFIIARSAATLGIVSLFMQTTRWQDVTKTLKAFGLPMIFVMVLDLTYRYIFLFMYFLYEYVLGKKSRVVGREHLKSRLSWFGISVAGFFRMASHYGLEISQAMQARGYNGKTGSKQHKVPAWKDYAYILVAIGIGIFVQ